MTDNLANIRNYQIQLQQVETALVSDPDNEELKKLQIDLQEVINLTMNIMDKDELALLDNSNTDGSMSHNFKAGDYVLAPWSEDGQFYEAQIEDITSDGQCTVVFSHQKKRLAEVCLVELLKPISGKNRRPYNGGGSSGSSYNSKNIGNVDSGDRSNTSSMKHFKQAQEAREAQKKKQQKRKEKVKLLEEEREKEKMKWQSFSTKVAKKKGSSKKSIFATPESSTGRVGVGTCGVGGKPMTEYQMKMEKVKKTVTSLPKFSLGDDEAGGSGASYNRSRY